MHLLLAALALTTMTAFSQKLAKIADAHWAKVETTPPPFWSSRLSDPYPVDWPSEKPAKFIVYATAYGFSPTLSDGELVGPTWAKLTAEAGAPEKAAFKRLAKEIKQLGTIGVRPLEKAEQKVLDADPLTLFAARSAANDAKLKAYYCLRKSLGSVPDLAVKEHGAFFKWLGCK